MSKAASAPIRDVEEKNRKDIEPGIDTAWEFIQRHGNQATLTIDLSKIRHKVDLHIIPLMFLCYTLQFLDKVIYNYAAVMNISSDLNLVGNDFSNIATFFFVAYLVFEIPNTIFLLKFPAAKWLGANVVLWGIATACGAAATNMQTLLVSRVFLGIFEATIGPSLLLISSQWYTKNEAAPRFSLWYLGLGVGQIIGGALSYAFQHVGQGSAMEGWRIMFLVLGIVTAAVGVLVISILPDSPMNATWLTDGEKLSLIQHVSVNRTGIEGRKFRMTEIFEAFADPQVWMLTLAVILYKLSVSSGVVTTYSSTLIRNLGYTSKQAALINMPSGIVSIMFTILVGYGIRKRSHRWAWIIICIIPGIMGGALMSFLPETNQAGILAGIYLVNAIVAPLPVYYNWISANISGYTKRPFCASLVAGSFSVGNIIGPQTFQAKDAPGYRPAKIAILGTQAGCALVTILLFFYYVWCNRRRAISQGDESESRRDRFLDVETWKGKTDKEMRDFIYVY